ncbi:hypothetical protein SAY87_011495 [Trapa incisa]|uniref:Uncharacterized protein n=1 Tax=Trapa incisa TaxID=236973 RepID=A0AAN7GIM6_9MYRT|nr:hypothetical protein SAY87_011495 [Trapa incisa]
MACWMERGSRPWDVMVIVKCLEPPTSARPVCMYGIDNNSGSERAKEIPFLTSNFSLKKITAKTGSKSAIMIPEGVGDQSGILGPQREKITAMSSVARSKTVMMIPDVKDDKQKITRIVPRKNRLDYKMIDCKSVTRQMQEIHVEFMQINE